MILQRSDAASPRHLGVVTLTGFNLRAIHQSPSSKAFHQLNIVQLTFQSIFVFE